MTWQAHQASRFTIPKAEYIAACRYAEDAVLMIAGRTGSKIKHGGRIVWREGQESVSALESIDAAAEIVWERIRLRAAQRWARYSEGATA